MKPRNAVILAAGMGMRMLPLNTVVSKGLIEVNGEALIERQIRHLHEVGITDITIVVGFMKESYDYLIDKYGVKLMINTEYASKNNLHSLLLASEEIGNTYILPSDFWFRKNPYSVRELHSWFMVSDRMDERSYIRVNRKQELVEIDPEEDGNFMVGVAYITREDASGLIKNLRDMDRKRKYSGSFWEDALIENSKMAVWSKVIDDTEAIEINSYEDLRSLEDDPGSIAGGILHKIASALGTSINGIGDIRLLKNGPTNRTMHIAAEGNEYAVRIPRKDVRQFIDRRREKEVYDAVKGLGIADDVVWFDAESGIKISRFIPESRPCNGKDEGDMASCMRFMRRLHEMKLSTGHEIDLFATIEFYEGLWNGVPSLYRDYQETKENVLSLRPFIEENRKEYVLCHSEAVGDNFMIGKNGEIKLIDWEYAGMQDPDMDIAMTLIYSGYGKEESDRIMDAYYPEGMTDTERRKIYALMAVCGLLWSNWCEYKTHQGVEFGGYAMKQYRYAKDFYNLAKK